MEQSDNFNQFNTKPFHTGLEPEEDEMMKRETEKWVNKQLEPLDDIISNLHRKD